MVISKSHVEAVEETKETVLLFIVNGRWEGMCMKDGRGEGSATANRVWNSMVKVQGCVLRTMWNTDEKMV